jgi:hypothetical protein
MAKWQNADVLDPTLAYIRANASVLYVVRGYTVGETFAAVLANQIATVALAPADFVIADAPAGARRLTLAAKSAVATAASGTAPDTHFVLANLAAQQVLWVTDETGNAVVTVGQQLTIPPLTCTANQPT